MLQKVGHEIRFISHHRKYFAVFSLQGLQRATEQFNGNLSPWGGDGECVWHVQVQSGAIMVGPEGTVHRHVDVIGRIDVRDGVTMS